MQANRVSVCLVLLAFTGSCRSEQSAPDPQGNEEAAEAPAAAAAEAEKPAANSAEGIASIAKGLPLYPNSKPKIPTTWTVPDQFAANKWGSTYEADTADPMEKVLDYYEKEMAAQGWTGKRMFKGMIAFEKKSAPHKSVTLVSGADEKVPGQTLLRVLVVDE